MTTVHNLGSKLERLIRVSLHRKWSGKLFGQLCGQFQESHEPLDPHIVGDALFACGQHTPMDALFAEYIETLTMNDTSVFPMHQLLRYLQSSRLAIGPNLLIYLGQVLHQTDQPDLSAVITEKTAESLQNYMRSVDQNNGDVVKGLAYFVNMFIWHGGHIDRDIFESFLRTVEVVDPFLAGKCKRSWDSRSRNGTLQNLGLTDGNGINGVIKKHVNNDISANMEAQNNSKNAFLNGTLEFDVPASKTRKLHRGSRMLWLESIFPHDVQGDELFRELEAIASELMASDVNLMGSNEKSMKNESDPFPKEIEGVMSEFVVTVFDCLAVALLNKDSRLCGQWKVFIVKRIPEILFQLKKQNQIANVEHIIVEPISKLDSSTVDLLRVYGGDDAMDEMFSSFPSTTTDLRHDLIQACIELKILSPASAWKAVNDNNSLQSEGDSIRGPAGTEYIVLEDGTNVVISEVIRKMESESPDVPVEQSIMNSLLKLLEEIDGVRQNRVAQEICSALDEYVHRILRGKDAANSGNNNDQQALVHIGRLCLCLALQPEAMDIIFMHQSSSKMGLKLLMFLNTWTTNSDDDLQEPYADYGKVYIFTQLLWKRYDLDYRTDHHIREKEFRIESAARDGNQAMVEIGNSTGPLAPNLENMNEERKNLLGGWISALFDAGGIGDDLMRMSAAGEIINLVPSIFQQAVQATYVGMLDFETVKGGLEYFSQPFLLASLIPGLQLLCEMIKLRSTSPDIVLEFIQFLVSPGSMPKTTEEVHGAAISVVNKHIRQTLTWLRDETVKRNGSNKFDTIQLIDKIIAALGQFRWNDGGSLNNNAAGMAGTNSAGNGTSAIADMGSKFAESQGSATAEGSSEILARNVNFSTAARETINALTAWSQACDGGHTSCPPPHKVGWLAIGVETLGARRILCYLLDELDFAETHGSLDYALDIMVSLVLCGERTKYLDPLNLQESSLVELIKTVTEDQMTAFRQSGILSNNLGKLQERLIEKLKQRKISSERHIFPDNAVNPTSEYSITKGIIEDDGSNNEISGTNEGPELMEVAMNLNMELNGNGGTDLGDMTGFEGNLEDAYGDLGEFDENMMLMDL